MKSSPPPPRTNLTRRQSLVGALAASGVTLMGSAARATQTTANVVTDGGAVSGSTADQTPAFLRAFALLPASGGSLYVPAGTYYLNTALVLSPSFPLTIYGDDSGLSIIKVNNTGSGITIQPGSTSDHVAVHNLGFNAVAQASAALYIAMPQTTNDPGNQSCRIEDINILCSSSGSFTAGLHLSNIWKSFVSNVRMLGPTVITGTSLLTLDGFSIDNRFNDCYAEAVDIAFNIANYAEGVRLSKPIVVNCNTGLATGSAPYTLGGSSFININGLYIDGGEFNCLKMALSAYQVWTGCINSTHFGITNTGATPTCYLYGCLDLNMVGCNITGAVNSGSQSGVGIQLANTANAGCADNVFDSCSFSNVSTAIQFMSGVSANNAINIRLVSVTNFPTLATSNVVIDSSGNTLNQAIWLTGLTGTARLSYLH